MLNLIGTLIPNIIITYPIYLVYISAAKVTLFSRNHQEKHKKSTSYQQITAKSDLYYLIVADHPHAVSSRTTWRDL